jgi:ABC-2 type transport system permease protein
MSWLRVVRYALIVGKEECSEVTTVQAWLVGWLPRIAAQTIFYSMIGQLIGAHERVEYLVIGSAIVAGLASVALTVPQSTWDRSDGVYPLLVAAPAGLLLSIMGRTSVRMLTGIVTSLVAFIALPALFGIALPWPGALSLVPLVTVTIAGSWFVALFVGSLANLAPQGRNFMHNIATMTTMAFGGITVPVTFWPDWIQAFANVIPVTHGLLAIRLALAGGEPIAIVQHAATSLAVGLGWLVVAILTVDRMASVGRANGSIEFV